MKLNTPTFNRPELPPVNADMAFRFCDLPVGCNFVGLRLPFVTDGHDTLPMLYRKDGELTATDARNNRYNFTPCLDAPVRLVYGSS